MKAWKIHFLLQFLGGGDYIPELRKLSLDNITFSTKHDELNGFFQVNGTNWSTAGQIATLSGLPTKSQIFPNPFKNKFFKNVTFMGDILQKNGYLQEVLLCADKRFGGIEPMYLQHGNYKIYDIDDFDKLSDNEKKSNFLHMVDDKRLFKFAKQKLESYPSKHPFAFIITTGDTHFQYTGEKYKNKNLHPYAKILRKESKIVSDFISWCKKQDFYKDTLIVLVGDHLTMQSSFVDDLPKDYERKIYFAMLNSSVPDISKRNREFSHFDLFPTILAGMGAKIEGNKLGLGVNLFSTEQTLVEKLGIKKLNEEIAKKSIIYESFY